MDGFEPEQHDGAPSIACMQCGRPVEVLYPNGLCAECSQGSEGVEPRPPQGLADITCIHCNRPLRVLSPRELCRHCGAAVASSIAFDRIDLDTRTVTADALCTQCGYNLRMQPIDGRCPECAAPVWPALRPNLLYAANSRWLKKVRGGVTNLLIALLAPIAYGIVVVVFLLLLVALVDIGESDVILGLMSTAVSIVMLICWITGVFRTTAAPPHVVGARWSAWPANLARIGVVFATLAFFAILAGTASDLFAMFTSFYMTFPVMTILFGAAVVIGVIGMIALMIHLRQIARLGQRRGLARLTTVLAWMTGATVVLYVGSMILWLVMFIPFFPAPTGTATTTGPATTMPAASPIVISPGPLYAVATTFLSCIGPPVILVTYIIGIVALFKYRRLLSDVLVRRAGGAREVASWMVTR